MLLALRADIHIENASWNTCNYNRYKKIVSAKQFHTVSFESELAGLLAPNPKLRATLLIPN